MPSLTGQPQLTEPQRKELEAIRQAIRERREELRCETEFPYFVNTYCQVEAKKDGSGEWVPFELWPAQDEVAGEMQTRQRLVALKARQLGLSWLCVAFALWLALFHPIATILMFSLRDLEAKKLLKRLRGMHRRLPPWMQQDIKVKGARSDNTRELEFPNGSTVTALTKAGDSYTASLVVVDEADLIPKLDDLLESLKPTVADGGRIFLVSRSYKNKPESPFKNIYRAAKAGKSEWKEVFIPWHARPGRTLDWYEKQKQEALAESGNLDGFYGNYPASDAEALAPRAEDKRIAPEWLQACFREGRHLDTSKVPGVPAIPSLRVYRLAEADHKYIVGGDPAEGNPKSDDSAGEVLDAATGEQVASLAGRFEPAVFASHLAALALYYNRAAIMVERNNHGHAVILALGGRGLMVLTGRDGKTGWVSSELGKALMYDSATDQIKNREVIIHDLETFSQLSSIEGSTLKAPKGQHDDKATAFALAQAARPRTQAVVYRRMK